MNEKFLDIIRTKCESANIDYQNTVNKLFQNGKDLKELKNLYELSGCIKAYIDLIILFETLIEEEGINNENRKN